MEGQSSRRTRITRATSALFALTLLATPAAAQHVRPNFPVANGGVVAMAMAGDTLFLTGAFTELSPYLGGGIPVNESDATPWPRIPAVDGVVNAATPDGNGGWFVGGRFEQVGGAPRRNLAHILANGVLASWRADADDEVLALDRVDGALVVGGRFRSVAGVPRAGLAALNELTGELSGWKPGVHGQVEALAHSGSTVYVGGAFDSLASQPCPDLGAIELGSTVPFTGLPHPDSFVNELLVVGAEVYVAGNFGTLSGQVRHGLGVFDAGTGALSPWAPNFDVGTVRVGASPTTLYCAGSFASVDGQPRKGLAAFDLGSKQLLPWSPATTRCIFFDVAFDAGRVYAAAYSYACGSTYPSNEQVVVALDPSTGGQLPWNAHVVGLATRLAASEGTLFIARGVTGAGGSTRHGVAAIHAPTGAILDWYAPLTGNATTLRLAGPRLYVAGGFSVPGVPAHTNLVALDRTTGAVVPWFPPPYYSVQDVATLGDTVYVLASRSVFGNVQTVLEGVDAATGAATAWHPNVGFSELYALAAAPGRVFIAGHLSSVDGLPRENLAAVDPVSGAALPWAPSVGYDIQRLLTVGDQVFAAGDIGVSGCRTCWGVAAFDVTSGALSNSPVTRDILHITWNVGLAGDRIFTGSTYVRSLTFGVPDEGCVAGYDLATGARLSGLPLVGADDGFSTVGPVAGDERSIFAGGSFGIVEGLPRDHLVAIDFQPPVTTAPPGTAHGGPLLQPSPWRTRATVTVPLAHDGLVRVELFDANGRRVAEPVPAHWEPAGTHRFELDTAALPPGLYLCRVQAGVTRAALKAVHVQ